MYAFLLFGVPRGYRKSTFPDCVRTRRNIIGATKFYGLITEDTTGSRTDDGKTVRIRHLDGVVRIESLLRKEEEAIVSILEKGKMFAKCVTAGFALCGFGFGIGGFTGLGAAYFTPFVTAAGCSLMASLYAFTAMLDCEEAISEWHQGIQPHILARQQIPFLSLLTLQKNKYKNKYLASQEAEVLWMFQVRVALSQLEDSRSISFGDVISKHLLDTSTIQYFVSSSSLLKTLLECSFPSKLDDIHHFYEKNPQLTCWESCPSWIHTIYMSFLDQFQVANCVIHEAKVGRMSPQANERFLQTI